MPSTWISKRQQQVIEREQVVLDRRAADLVILEEWSLRLLDAATLEEVLRST